MGTSLVRQINGRKSRPSTSLRRGPGCSMPIPCSRWGLSFDGTSSIITQAGTRSPTSRRTSNKRHSVKIAAMISCHRNKIQAVTPEVETKLYTSQQHIRPAFVTDTSYGRMLFQVVSADISAHDVTSRTGYNLCMARGWESKAVEEQQAEARTKPDPNKVRLEPNLNRWPSKRNGKGCYCLGNVCCSNFRLRRTPFIARCWKRLWGIWRHNSHAWARSEV